MSIRVTLCCVVAFTVLIGSTAGQEDAWRLHAEPRIQIVRTAEPGTLLCTLRDGAGGKIPITSCGFQENYYENTWEWNLGSASPEVNQKVRGANVTVKYHGLGLQEGECGIHMALLEVSDLVPLTTHVFGCRVKAQEQGPWYYATAGVVFTDDQPMQFTLKPPEVLLADAGSDVTLQWTTEKNIDYWHFYITHYKHWVFLYADDKEKSRSLYRIWLRDQSCGLTWRNVQPDNSGFLRVGVFNDSPGGLAIDFVSLIVKTPPASPPILTVSIPEEGFEEGDMLEATCFVSGSRPVANITWLLDGDVIRQDTLNQAPVDSTWRWVTDMQPIMQTLSRRLTAQDEGKVLKCQAGHSALPSGFLNSINFEIRYRGSQRCPAIVDPSLSLHCHLEGTPVDCAQPMAVGTVVDMRCRRGYLMQEYVGYNSVECTSSHVWSDALLKCVPDCGKRNSMSVQLVANGQTADVHEFSWHVGVYQLSRNDHYAQICGGTLITRALVISAAHCFWNISSSFGNGQPFPTSIYKIVAGKSHREFYIEDEGAQQRDVAEIHVEKRYNGVLRNDAYDIAIIKVAEEFVLNVAVNVICMDYLNYFEDEQLRPGNNGTVAGWGVTENNTQSDVLMSVDLPYVEFLTCVEQVEVAFQRFVTHDKICGGYIGRSTSVCPGDSGGGYVFPKETVRGTRYFLRGIVSVGHKPKETGRKCVTQQLSAFTRVSAYREFIIGHVFNKTPGG